MQFQSGMPFDAYVNSIRQNDLNSMNQSIVQASQGAPVVSPEYNMQGFQMPPMTGPPGFEQQQQFLTSPPMAFGGSPYPQPQGVFGQPAFGAPAFGAPAFGSQAAPAGYVLQPDFGMIPVPPDALASNCCAKPEEDALTALVTLTFRPKKLSDDDKEAMEKIYADKAAKDMKLTADEKVAADKKNLADETEFWAGAIKKNSEIYFSKIQCEAVYIYEPEVKPDNSGVRVYMVEIKKKDGSPIAAELKDPTALNEFIKIIPVIKKQEGFPEVVYNASLRLADCQSEKHLAARGLTDKANAAQMNVVKALANVEDLTRPAVEAAAAIPAKEAEMKRAEVTLASWNKYKEMMKDNAVEAGKAAEETSKASAAKATAKADLDKVTTDYDEKLAKLRAAKQEVVAAEFDVQQAVDKADKVRKDVPSTCALFDTGAAFMCSNGCGYTGSQADVTEHEDNCDVEYSCDAPDCPFKGNFEDTQKHEAQCPKLKAVNNMFGFGASMQPQMSNMFAQPMMFQQQPMMQQQFAQPMMQQQFAQPMMQQPMGFQSFGQPMY